MTAVVQALQPGERENLRAFLAFCRAEPMPTTPEGWLAREAEARERWPTVADLFDGWGVDAAAPALNARCVQCGEDVTDTADWRRHCAPPGERALCNPPACNRCGLTLARVAGPGAGDRGWACVRCDVGES